MRYTVILVTLALAGLFGCAQGTMTSFPDTRFEHWQTLQPAKSNSKVSADLPYNTEIIPPAADVPAAQAAWSGKWSGWACRDRACDIKLAVTRVRTNSAAIVYVFASSWQGQFVEYVEAKFVWGELQADLGGGARVAYRMRSKGIIDYLWTRGENWAAGVLTKDN